MPKCPMNNFNECYGSSCEWHIRKSGCCAIASIAQNTKDLEVLPLIHEYQKNSESLRRYAK